MHVKLIQSLYLIKLFINFIYISRVYWMPQYVYLLVRMQSITIILVAFKIQNIDMFI